MNDGNTVALRQYESNQHKSAEQSELDMQDEIKLLLRTKDGILDLLKEILSDKCFIGYRNKFLHSILVLLAYPNNESGVWTSGVEAIRSSLTHMAVEQAERKVYGE